MTLTDLLGLYNEKKSEYTGVVDLIQQRITSLQADKEALTTELAGQSEEYIAKRKKKIDKDIEKQQKSLSQFTTETEEKIETWFNEQKKKVDDAIKRVTELEAKAKEKVLEMQGKVITSIETGVKAATENNPVAEAVAEKIAEVPVPKNYPNYSYSYIRANGDEIMADIDIISKRKAIKSEKLLVMEDEALTKLKIYRHTYEWSVNYNREKLVIDNENDEIYYTPIDSSSFFGLESFEEALTKLPEPTLAMKHIKKDNFASVDTETLKFGFKSQNDSNIHYSVTVKRKIK